MKLQPTIEFWSNDRHQQFSRTVKGERPSKTLLILLLIHTPEIPRAQVKKIPMILICFSENTHFTVIGYLPWPICVTAHIHVPLIKLGVSFVYHGMESVKVFILLSILMYITSSFCTFF